MKFSSCLAGDNGGSSGEERTSDSEDSASDKEEDQWADKEELYLKRYVLGAQKYSTWQYVALIQHQDSSLCKVHISS